MGHIDTYFSQVAEIATKIDKASIDGLVSELSALRARGGAFVYAGCRR